MKNPDIRHYKRELGKAVRGFRCRKRVLAEFQCSLSPLLEDQPTPTYADLEEAFGPPDQMAQDLIETIPDLPKPLKPSQKIGIVVASCFVIAVACIGVFSWENMPESKVMISDGKTYTENVLSSSYTSRLNTAFSQSDLSWDQEKKYEYNGYLLLFENTNQVETVISVKYSDRQSPHIFVVPAESQVAIQVDDARPTEHIISFDTPDGSMSGTVQVFLRLPS